MSRTTKPDEIDSRVARDGELKSERSALERDLESIEANIAGERSKAAEDKAAHELLADGVATLRGVTDLHSQRDAVRQKLRIVGRAIEINRRELDETRSAMARRITEERRPQYAEIVRELKQHVTGLQAAAMKEVAFRRQLERDGGSMGNGVIHSLGIDPILFAPWIDEAAQHYGV
jgi:hypothetical protein